MKRLADSMLAVLLVAGITGWFLLSTLLMDTVHDLAIVASAAVGALVLGLAAEPPRLSLVGEARLADLLKAAAGGLAALFAAPWLVLANRFTDAPSGSETLFLTTSAWAVIALGFAAMAPARRPNLRQWAYALIGLVGAAALLANWERPSSFSPFVRFPTPAMSFLIAGVLWMGGTMAISSAARRSRLGDVLFVATAPAVLASVLGLAVSGGFGTVFAATGSVAALATAAVCSGVVMVSWLMLGRSKGSAALAGMWLLPAVAVTMLGVAEQTWAPRGPNPIVWQGAGPGMVLCVIGAIGILMTRDTPALRAPEPTKLRPRGVRAGIALSAASLGATLGALALPAIAASVQGTLANGEAYSARWSLLGYETAGGWAAVVAAALLLAGALGARSARGPWSIGAHAAAAAVALASYGPLASTPLHTWNRWVPVDIQSEYGTEYALLQFSAVHDPVRLGGLALGGAAVVVLAGCAIAMWRSQMHPSSEAVA